MYWIKTLVGLNIVHLNYIGNLLQIQFQKAFQKDFWKCVLISTELGCFRKLFSKVSQKVFQTRKGFRKSIELGLREPNKPSFRTWKASVCGAFLQKKTFSPRTTAVLQVLIIFQLSLQLFLVLSFFLIGLLRQWLSSPLTPTLHLLPLSCLIKQSPTSHDTTYNLLFTQVFC